MLALFRSARALAASLEREYVIPDDVKLLAGPVLEHRMLLAPHAQVRGTTLEEVGTLAAENRITVFELYRPRQSLEAVFLELTGGTEAGR